IVYDDTTKTEQIFSESFSCPDCGISYEELSPRMFSFNNPYGACPRCGGLGSEMRINPDLVVPNKDLSLIQGAVVPWGEIIGKWIYSELKSLAEFYGFSLHQPFNTLPDEVKEIIFYGSGEKEIPVYHESSTRSELKIQYKAPFEGVIPWLERRYKQTDSLGVKLWIERFMSRTPCPACGGMRLKPESLSVLINGYSIGDVCKFSIKEAYEFFSNLHEYLNEKERTIAEPILKEIKARLGFLRDVGVDYLTLDREASTLSGGEAQRIHLATQIGSKLVGVLYILDEPSIGLHPRDNMKLLDTLLSLRDLGNTVVVIEHDRDTIEKADYVVDLGPGAGENGGYLVFSGTPSALKKFNRSITGAYLSGRERIEIPKIRRQGSEKHLVLEGCTGNNLKNIRVEFPLGTFICVTGVSGSGKSSLVCETLYPILARYYHRSSLTPLPYKRIYGLGYLDKVINIDQSPIGRTPRSNPATYTGVFTFIRELFANLPEAKARGYRAGRFSFNVKGGRCESCQGAGVIKLEMHFLPDVYVTCDVCKGRRYDRETLQIMYKGKNIYDVLNMTVTEALEFFKNIPRIKEKLELLRDVGLGYIRLGQPATTLSGGEAQRVKLSLELSRHDTGNTLYILDEPTVGLHPYDVLLLLNILHRLVDKGNTVIVIEHNIDIIKTADWIIDMGPEGGNDGGQIVACGTPETIAQNPNSYTGIFLKKEFEKELVFNLKG
ncbi:MAG: excinuclease ABC subunit UvrA, partial [bacterium]